MRSFCSLALVGLFSLVIACGSDDDSSSGAGGSNTGGANVGGSDTGGSDAGGSNTGGSDSGGSHTGGANTGGSNTGGANVGGSDNPDPTGSSKGKGGLNCEQTESLGSDGRTACVHAVGAVQLKITLPADAETNHAPLYLALYAHGDGAGAHRSNSAAKVLLPWVDAHHAVFVSARAPNECSWWREPSYTTCTIDDPQAAAHRDKNQENAVALEAAITAVRGAYDIRNDVVFYYGSSGGSMFLSGSFWPKYGNRYPGALALLCGGEKPWSPFEWDTKNTVERGSTKMFFHYGDKDIALIPDLHTTPSTFTELGFNVVDHFVANQSEHCKFEENQGGHQRALQVWNEFVAEL